jgi:hypothetical protein
MRSPPNEIDAFLNVLSPQMLFVGPLGSVMISLAKSERHVRPMRAKNENFVS